MTQIEVVLFDLGNVIVYIDPNNFWKTLRTGDSNWIKPYVDDLLLWEHRYERGEITTRDFLQGMSKILSNKFSLSQIESAFVSIIEEPVEGMFEIIKRTSSTHDVALVSNTCEIHYSISVAKLGALRYFQKHYLSYELKVMKPDRKFYEAVIADQQREPSKILFIDDLEINVETAVQCGMHAIPFESTSKLEQSLKLLDILQ